MAAAALATGAGEARLEARSDQKFWAAAAWIWLHERMRGLANMSF